MPPIKIAAMIQAHHRPQNLKLLLDRLSGALWRPIVHLDAKSDLGQFQSLLSEKNTTSSRVAVRWGGLSSVHSILVLLRNALELPDVTHVYLMSGQCYPVKDDDYIEQLIRDAAVGAANWMTRKAMPTPDKPVERFTKLWAYDLPTPMLRRIGGGVFRRIPAMEHRLGDLAPFGGSAWWLLERQAAARTLKYFDDNAWLLRALRYSFIPDEFVFQTVTAHLDIKTSGECPTATIWRRGSPHPETITPESYTECALDANKLFARKFASFYPDSRVAAR